jgi:uncharacterized BrkB/YihY/UPF0761 family membrane protein
LNRLRTLALAVVSLTRFAPVAIAEEDQAYFEAYNKRAKLDDLHKLIQERGDVLLNVQQAEANEEQTRHEFFLSAVILFLTGFTLLSVITDVYSFMKDEDDLKINIVRLKLLISIISFIVLFVILLLRGIPIRKRDGRGYLR